MSTKINIPAISKRVRTQNVNETLKLLKTQINKFWSWGSHAFTNIDNKFLRFTVNGHHHRGHIYITVNGNDLYDIYLTSNRGNIKKEIKDIYFDDLVNTIDENIEKIPAYKD